MTDSTDGTPGYAGGLPYGTGVPTGVTGEGIGWCSMEVGSPTDIGWWIVDREGSPVAQTGMDGTEPGGFRTRLGVKGDAKVWLKPCPVCSLAEGMLLPGGLPLLDPGGEPAGEMSPGGDKLSMLSMPESRSWSL